ncbi:MAG: ribonuclease HII [Desulfobulbaceae bacterium]|nr:ribonuclease HII [Desulfobulbaceae bacterium]
MEVRSTKSTPQGEDNFRIERLLYSRGFVGIAGCDEVGRGPLAGPVVAACVVLPRDCDHSVFLDSKKLTHAKRVILDHKLHRIGALVGIGQVSEKKIDEINILQASLLAMKLAVNDLNKNGNIIDYLLVDGKFPVPLPIPQETHIKGESKSSSIAAASIAAKVERDRFMCSLHEKYPVYNFAQNKGYPTREHRQAILLHGPSPVHRYSFRGVKLHAG